MKETMEKELKYLGEQVLYHCYMDELFQITNKENNRIQVDGGSSLSTGIDCFGFGVMIGKKIERAKQKTNDELLFQIEVLKLKLEKTEKSNT